MPTRGVILVVFGSSSTVRGTWRLLGAVERDLEDELQCGDGGIDRARETPRSIRCSWWRRSSSALAVSGERLRYPTKCRTARMFGRWVLGESLRIRMWGGVGRWL